MSVFVIFTVVYCVCIQRYRGRSSFCVMDQISSWDVDPTLDRSNEENEDNNICNDIVFFEIKSTFSGQS